MTATCDLVTDLVLNATGEHMSAPDDSFVSGGMSVLAILTSGGVHDFVMGMTVSIAVGGFTMAGTGSLGDWDGTM